MVTLYTTWENTLTVEYRSQVWLNLCTVKGKRDWIARSLICYVPWWDILGNVLVSSELPFFIGLSCWALFSRKLLIGCSILHVSVKADRSTLHSNGNHKPNKRTCEKVMGFGGFKCCYMEIQRQEKTLNSFRRNRSFSTQGDTQETYNNSSGWNVLRATEKAKYSVLHFDSG